MAGQGDCVSIEDLEKRRANYHVIDVRAPADYAAAHVDGAVNIPLDRLRDHAGGLPAGVIPLTVCGKGGGRSAEGARILRELGRPDAVWLCGGTDAWVSRGPGRKGLGSH